jgi:hypothetical protein
LNLKGVRVLDLFLGYPVQRIGINAHVRDGEEEASDPVSNKEYNCKKLDQVHEYSNRIVEEEFFKSVDKPLEF